MGVPDADRQKYKQTISGSYFKELANRQRERGRERNKQRARAHTEMN